MVGEKDKVAVTTSGSEFWLMCLMQNIELGSLHVCVLKKTWPCYSLLIRAQFHHCWLVLYQCSDHREVFSHLPEKSPRPDVPQLQGFVPEHHHKVLSEGGHDKDTLRHCERQNASNRFQEQWSRLVFTLDWKWWPFYSEEISSKTDNR